MGVMSLGNNWFCRRRVLQPRTGGLCCQAELMHQATKGQPNVQGRQLRLFYFRKRRQFIIEQQFHRFARTHPMLAASWYVTTYAAEHFCPFHTAETTGYFLMDFRHSNIPLTLVIGERHNLIVHKAHNILFIINEPFKPVSWFTPF